MTMQVTEKSLTLVETTSAGPGDLEKGVLAK